jgi:peptidoglycan/xylan/chitin deacetylase (PgdA/CDA1 family)
MVMAKRHDRFRTKGTVNTLLLALYTLVLLSSDPGYANHWQGIGETGMDQVPAASYDVDIPILAYHKIDPVAPTHWYVAAEQFSRQMDVLLAYGYQAISLDDYLDYQQGTSIPPDRPIMITLDDGTQGQYQFAAPILLDRNLEATFFIPTGKIAETEVDRQDTSWQSAPEPLTYHLIWPEIVELFHLGFHIESHSINHPVLTDLDPLTAQHEITQSRLDIQSHLPGNSVHFFAYPYGIDNANIQGYVQDAGYQAAVDFDPDDGIANPATSNIWELPRRGIYRDVSLDLDPSDPWWFFMRRVDPDFPLPNITLYNYTTYDDSGGIRDRFYLGEPITMTARVSNWWSPVNVTGALNLSAGSDTMYDSHTQDPIADVHLDPLPYGSNSGVFSYAWRIPETAPTGLYSYTLDVKDEFFLLGYYDSGARPAFTVEAPPISLLMSPEEIILSPNENTELVFTVSYSGVDAEQMVLTVSLSSGLTVTQAIPSVLWTEYPIGSWVQAKGCSNPCIQTSNLMYQLSEDLYGGGAQSYNLYIQPVPGANQEQWIRYRLAMRIPDQLTPDWFLRSPLGGEVDQQEYYAYFQPVNLLENTTYLPLVAR